MIINRGLKIIFQIANDCWPHTTPLSRFLQLTILIDIHHMTHHIKSLFDCIPRSPSQASRRPFMMLGFVAVGAACTVFGVHYYQNSTRAVCGVRVCVCVCVCVLVTLVMLVGE